MSDSQGRQPHLVPRRTFQPTFAAGELAPELHHRSDLEKWHGGAAGLRNWIVLVQGAAARRGGTAFVGLADNYNGSQRLIPFQFSTEDQFMIEAGGGYFRFITAGAFITGAGALPIRIVTPYTAVDLPTLRFVQSADVLTIVHPGHQPMELRRYSATDWRLVPFSTGTSMPAPTGLTAEARITTAIPGSPPPAAHPFEYAVSATNSGQHDEGPLSASATCNNQDLGYWKQYGTLNHLAWNATPGADLYTVYRRYQGRWARVSSTTDTFFDDINFTPDTAISPPVGTDPFANYDWPGTVGYFQERQLFGGSLARPETLRGSKSGAYRDFDVSNPVRDDDAINYTLAARQVNQIRHMLPLENLVLMTGGNGWVVDGSSPVTPSNFAAKPLSIPGASNVEPLVIGNRILYVDAKGSGVRELAYAFVSNQYVAEDRTVFSRHLFDGHRIVSWAYAETPNKLVWAIRDDGLLLSMTYLAEQQVYAWATHDSPGAVFRWVAVITDNVDGVTEDVPYFVVQRQVAGQSVTMIERMHTRRMGRYDNDVRLAWHLDCALQYYGPPVVQVGNLHHLAGAAVAVLADGVPGVAVVRNDAVALANVTPLPGYTMPAAASVVLVGLCPDALLTLLPMSGGQPAADPMMGRLKHSYRVRVAVRNAAGLMAAVDGSALTVLAVHDDEPYPDGLLPVGMVTTVLEARIAEGWTRDGQLSLATTGGLPATVLGVAMEWTAGE